MRANAQDPRDEDGLDLNELAALVQDAQDAQDEMAGNFVQNPGESIVIQVCLPPENGGTPGDGHSADIISGEPPYQACIQNPSPDPFPISGDPYQVCIQNASPEPSTITGQSPSEVYGTYGTDVEFKPLKVAPYQGSFAGQPNAQSYTPIEKEVPPNDAKDYSNYPSENYTPVEVSVATASGDAMDSKTVPPQDEKSPGYAGGNDTFAPGRLQAESSQKAPYLLGQYGTWAEQNMQYDRSQMYREWDASKSVICSPTASDSFLHRVNAAAWAINGLFASTIYTLERPPIFALDLSGGIANTVGQDNIDALASIPEPDMRLLGMGLKFAAVFSAERAAYLLQASGRASALDAIAATAMKQGHVLRVRIFDKTWNLLTEWFEVSEKGLSGRLGDTEQLALRKMDLTPGQTVVFEGYLPPCPYSEGCQRAMSEAAKETGANILYWYPDPRTGVPVSRFYEGGKGAVLKGAYNDLLE